MRLRLGDAPPVILVSPPLVFCFGPLSFLAAASTTTLSPVFTHNFLQHSCTLCSVMSPDSEDRALLRNYQNLPKSSRQSRVCIQQYCFALSPRQ